LARPLRVLFVEDREKDVELLVLELRRGGYDPVQERVDTPEAFASALDRQGWDVILCDYSMPRFSAKAALALFKEKKVDLPFIVVSGTVGEETAVEALSAGAHDFMTKGKLSRLLPAIDRELREAASRAERKQMQEQLRLSQKMEAVGQLAGGIAHDFNNMLTAILGYADLLTNEVGKGSPLLESIGEIRKAGERAASLTRQLLAFSRRQVLEPKVLDLNALVENLENMLRRLIGEDVELVTVLDPGIGRVRADAGQLEQVIVNLAVNARDAMPKGGTLTIETKDVELDEAYAREHISVRPGRYVMLAVSDIGLGMSVETKSHMFEPFFTTKGKGKGTGLGLATVYGIVKQSGGYVWVYSELDLGTSFKIYLPRVEEAAEAEGARRLAEHATGGSETVLLVEDEQSVRTLVRRILESYGYTVIEASGAAQALEAARRWEGPIHLILTDVVMPEMGGSELAPRVAELRPDVRVIFMSGYTDDAILRQGLIAEGGHFLQKPFTPEVLARKVREVLNS
jgi:two-component system cell cycle sensor histidine kinase/response regulator CckA